MQAIPARRRRPVLRHCATSSRARNPPPPAARPPRGAVCETDPATRPVLSRRGTGPAGERAVAVSHASGRWPSPRHPPPPPGLGWPRCGVVQDRVKDKLYEDVESKINGEYGYIVAVVQIDEIGHAEIVAGRGHVIIPVKCVCVLRGVL